MNLIGIQEFHGYIDMNPFTFITEGNLKDRKGFL